MTSRSAGPTSTPARGRRARRAAAVLAALATAVGPRGSRVTRQRLGGAADCGRAAISGPTSASSTPACPWPPSRRASTRSTRSRSTTRWAPALRAAVQARAPTARPREPADLPGRLLHRGRRARRATRPTSPSTATSTSTTGASTPDNCIALNNFWRSLSNLTINVDGADGLPRVRQLLGRVAGRADAPGQHHRRQPDADGLLHRRPAVRQRRLHRRLADRRSSSTARSSSTSCATAASAAGRTRVWNQVFAGVAGRAGRRHVPRPRRTRRSTTTPVSREKPFLYVDAAGTWQRARARGRAPTRPARPGRTARPRAGRSRCRTSIVARPSDSVTTINSAAGPRASTCCSRPASMTSTARITVQPGRHRRARPRASRPSPPSTARCRCGVGDVPGVVVAGIMIDAGPVNSPRAACGSARPGARRRARDAGQPDDPAATCFFRVGGPARRQGDRRPRGQQRPRAARRHLGLARRPRRPGAFGWTVNTADNGVIVNGDDVTATGLFVEHYQQYNVDLERRARRAPSSSRTSCPTTRRTRRPGSTTASLGWAGVQGRRHGAHPRAVGRRQLHLHQRRPDAPRDARLRGAGRPRACGCTTCSPCSWAPARSTTSSTTPARR